MQTVVKKCNLLVNIGLRCHRGRGKTSLKKNDEVKALNGNRQTLKKEASRGSSLA